MALKPYVIKQGDFLDKLAFTLAFKAEEVWTDAKNAELAKKRDPNVLLPGEELWVPDEPPPPKPMEGGTANDYSANVPKAKLKLVFKDDKGPVAGEPYELKGVPEAKPGDTGPGGEVELEVPVILREFELTLTKRGITYKLHVGNMDPIDDPAGQRKRMHNLGYRAGPGTKEADRAARDAALLAAFQRAQELTPTGTIDDTTLAALLKAYGH